ncbi:cytochrome c oxidase assembly protein [Virgibacillus kimchii]
MLDIILDEFHFSTMWNGGIFLFLMFGLIIYFFLLPEDKFSLKKAILFVAGTIALFAALGSPLNVIGRIQFSTHIIQLILLLLVSPPLLILGFKNKIFEKVKSYAFLDKTFRFLTRPVTAAVLFQVFFYGYHVPVIFNFARMDLYLNYFFLLVIFISAILLWIPIISQNILSKRNKVIYILINGLLLVPYSLVLILAKDALYIIYTDVDLFVTSLEACFPDVNTVPDGFFAALLPFEPVHEQKIGGWYLLGGQMIIFGITLLLLSFKERLEK